ncbi:putative radical SAM superfamily protein [Erwinia phage pEa_SNUABM_5]|uniref:Putative radical SAM superfamily protein n=1 Tax=Erwinia phage pEa_SNUABM_5 TaxID=2797313 RepID=A0A7T8EPQ3_9CAUD|nr:putative radical SAM superfamily protein [Erwinia phage pEa_SNUABM_5]QQO90425.1 putative radical SAM superfamily protein [Erwinia phage pEa_SNUABM_5]
MTMLRNFTAVLPVTCNADCGFCPEKEMEEKAKPKEWQAALIDAITDNEDRVDHVSISGGEPTLRMNFLFDTIDEILSRTGIGNVGLTTNGRFLESANSTLKFLDLNTDRMLRSKLSHLNISMHSFDRAMANKIMGVEYSWTLDDLVRFRRQLGRDVSFHINFVVNQHNIGNIEQEFILAQRFMHANPMIDVVFRIDYNNDKLNRELRTYGQSVEAWREATRGSIKEEKEARKRIRKQPKLLQTFDEIFSGSLTDMLNDDWLPSSDRPNTSACPSCFTHQSPGINNSFAWLKASAYEPNEDEPEFTELVFHMDGKLYYDWSRNTPVHKDKPLSAKAVKRYRGRREFDLEPKDEQPKKAAKKKKKDVEVKGGSCTFRQTSGSCTFRGN